MRFTSATRATVGWWRAATATVVLAGGLCASARGEPGDAGTSIFDFGRDAPTESPTRPPAPVAPQPRSSSPVVKPPHVTLPPATPGIPAVPAGVALPRSARARLPLPTRDEQAGAARLIRDVYGKQYADPARPAQAALAADLLRQADDAGNSPSTQFVLLRDAADCAARAGEVRTAMNAVATAARRYALEPAQELRVRAGGLALAARAAVDPTVLHDIAAQAAALSDLALRLDDLDAAERLAATAESAAARSKEALFARSVQAQSRNVNAARADAAAARAAAQLLARDPADAAANLAAGRYACLLRGDWETGLPLLAKGADGDLRGLAARSLAVSGDKAGDATAEQLLADGNGWWEWAERQPPTPRQRARQWAADEYRRALPKLGGLSKELAARRAVEVPAAARAELASADLTADADTVATATPTPAPAGPPTATGVTPPPTTPKPSSDPPPAAAKPNAVVVAPPVPPAPLTGGQLVADRVQAKRGVSAPAAGVVAFDAPNGDGRRGAKGVLVHAAPGWDAGGTAWSVAYTRGGTASMVQFVHPFGKGQCIVDVSAKSVGASQPHAWSEINYRGGSRKTLTRTPAYDTVFPLKDDTAYAVESRLARDGSYQLVIGGQVVATGRFADAGSPPLSLEGEPPKNSTAKGLFKALAGSPDLPGQLAPGDAALIVGPLDGGQHVCADVRLGPAAGGKAP